jgi:HEAT repeat protein
MNPELAKQATPDLIARLEDTDEQIQTTAITALGRIGDERAVEPLLALLKHRKEDVREKVIYALGYIGDARAVEALLALLNKRDGAHRDTAVFALGKIGDQRALDPLLEICRNEGEPMRRRAYRALGDLGDERALEPLIAALASGSIYERESAAEALGKIGDRRAVRPLLDAIEDYREDQASNTRRWSRSEAIEAVYDALGQIGGDDVTDLLIEMIQIDKLSFAKIRSREPILAARALGVIGDPRAIAPLIAMQGRHDIGHHASIALGKFGEQAVEPLIKTLENEEDSTILAGTALALSNTGDDRALEPILALRKHRFWASSWIFRKDVVNALLGFDDPLAIVALIDILQNEEEHTRVQEAAEKNLKWISSRDYGRDPEAWREWLERRERGEATLVLDNNQ